MALLENRKTRVDHKVIQTAVGTMSITVRYVMKLDADVYSPAFGSKDTNTATCLANELKLARVFNRHRFIEVEKPAVDMRERVDLRAVRKIELQAYRRDAGAVSSLALKCVNA